MNYVAAETATIHRKDGSTVQLRGDAAQRLYLHRNTQDQSVKWLRLLGGRNEFERSRQQQIVDRLAAAEVPGRKRVLLIGDSIRMRLCDTTGYGLHAYNQLLESVNLTHIPHNTGNTDVVLDHLEDWLSCKPDIVHINAGLHDLATAAPGAPKPPSHNPPKRYAANLRRIIQIIQRAGVNTIVWATITPVHNQWHSSDRKLHRCNEDVIQYNEIAAQVMAELNIRVDDLFQPLMKIGLERSLMRDGVHLRHDGSALLGKIVTKQVLQYC